MNMDPDNTLGATLVAVNQGQSGSNSDVTVPCGTPPYSSSLGPTTRTTTACAGPTTAQILPPGASTLLPAAAVSSTFDLPTAPNPLPSYHSTDDVDMPYHLLPGSLPPPTAAAAPCFTAGDTAAATSAEIINTHHLLPHSPPQYTQQCHAATPSSSYHTTPAAAAPPYTHTQYLPVAAEHNCPSYTLVVSPAGDIVREDCYCPGHEGGCIYGPGLTRGRGPECEPLQQFMRAPARGTVVGEVCVVRRWACTGILLVVGALPWIIAMATFIKQRNSALAGLLGLVFVFFMAVVLGRIIKRVQQAGWLQRQERRRRQFCMHHCSSQRLMSESPPAYEVVVKSPPPYSINCGGPPSSQSFPTNFPPTMTVGVSHNVQSAEGATVQGNLPTETFLDTRISTGHDRDSSLPSYDEAVQQWAT